MDSTLFEDNDLARMKSYEIKPEDIYRQIEIFKRGFPYSKLNRSCTIGDGIESLNREDLERLQGVHSSAAVEGRCMKFVPASGAATRMFKLPLNIYSRYDELKPGIKQNNGVPGDKDMGIFLDIMTNLRRFAFFNDLKAVLARDKLNIDRLVSRKQYKPILQYLLTDTGLGLSEFPKGLIKFHSYSGHGRTPIEEHIVEAIEYVKGKDRSAKLHFTVSPDHREAIENHIQSIQTLYEVSGVKISASFSTQKHSTDTIAVDMSNRPFRDDSGELLFRPAGHGALLENLNDLDGDIIYIKNIDNVVPDRIKEDTFVYKKALAGYLIELQERIFSYIQTVEKNIPGKKDLDEIIEFVKKRLSFNLETDVLSLKEIKTALFTLLNRPLRVCGMVKNSGEPGGGPFWVEHNDGTFTLQIVESSQVDHESSEQQKIWESSTHFNPVDIVCGVKDYKGGQFDLLKFRDPDTGFISVKSKNGRDLKALELPGLWNGSMAYWNTVFIEVPPITFNPVKTMADLLRKEHQPE